MVGINNSHRIRKEEMRLKMGLSELMYPISKFSSLSCVNSHSPPNPQILPHNYSSSSSSPHTFHTFGTSHKLKLKYKFIHFYNVCI